MVSKDTIEDKAEQLQLDGAGLNPLAEIQFHKLLYEASLTAMQEEACRAGEGHRRRQQKIRSSHNFFMPNF